MEGNVDQREHDQFANFFAALGAFIGFCYGAAISNGEFIAALIGAVICGVLGRVVGSIVYRIILVALLILGIFIRHKIAEAIGSLF
jgi:outer membrane lipoprotein SlyB